MADQKKTSSTQVYKQKVASSDSGRFKVTILTSNLLIVIGLAINGPKVASTSNGRSKATTSTSTSTKVTTSCMTKGKKVSKGKKVAAPEIVDIGYIIVEYMKKTRANISIFKLYKISSQQ